MSTTRVRITPEVEAVLQAGDIATGVFRLPTGQLERKLYTDVAKVLKALGGKWDRSRQGFPVTPAFGEALAEALSSGVAVDKDREAGFFATPHALAVHAVEQVGIGDPDDLILEPSAGDGALLREMVALHLPASMLQVYAVERDQGRYDQLKEEFPAAQLFNDDFLAMAPKWAKVGTLFNRVVMNPPFGKDQECKHVLAAISLLAEFGTLAAILPNGVEFRETGLAPQLRAAVADLGGRFFPLPEGSFKAAGTGVNTCLLVI